ncbi:TiaS agmantine-binding domain-containing protein [Cuniculiplasma sp. SKW3]|uniref:TiaS agmantine-binding domain-containing protein n=1 Tax=Cuniculiplasma sp. SKW3 TaxID=3400170 RepID=UPI003FD06524
MWIGIDDTDSREEMCTTYIAFLLSAKFGQFMTSFPRLVRLNPNLPFKTRGNGAISLELNEGKQNKGMVIGSFEGREIKIASSNSEFSRDEIMQGAVDLVKKYGVKNQVDTNPGIIVSENQFPEEIYGNALSRELSLEEIRKYLSGSGFNYEEYSEGNGRGIIGASASIAWRKRKVTYELISYSFPHPDTIERSVKERIGEIAESYASTFNNVDFENRSVSLFPRERTPVIYGIRGLRYQDLMEIQNSISREFPEYGKNYIIFETNQGTDDHIEYMPKSMSEYGSYGIRCSVISVPRREKGGHLKFESLYNGKIVNMIAFEPSKNFRRVLQMLRPGDFIEVYGSMGKGSLKIEKINVLALARIYSRTAPECSICGENTKNYGNLTFRCPECGHLESPSYEEIPRQNITGKYEPPVSARRHLSMPWKLEGAF